MENYFFPGDLKRQIERFVKHYIHERYRKNLNNILPADVYPGTAQLIIRRTDKIKTKTIEHRQLQYREAVA